MLGKLSAAIMLCAMMVIVGCANQDATPGSSSGEIASAGGAGQSGVMDDESQKDVVKIAVGSKDHTTLVAAIKAAELVDALSNAGPFTVFAPTNAAFDALPAGTVENLVKPENKFQLTDILYHHVTTTAFDEEALRSRSSLQLFDGQNATVEIKDGAIYIDGAKILGSVRGSNGIVHVIDKVLLPK